MVFMRLWLADSIFKTAICWPPLEFDLIDAPHEVRMHYGNILFLPPLSYHALGCYMVMIDSAKGQAGAGSVDIDLNSVNIL